MKNILMDKNRAATLKRLRKRIRTLEKAIVTLPNVLDEMPFMRIHRNELGEKAVEVVVLSEAYFESELKMARRVAKILNTQVLSAQRDMPGPLERILSMESRPAGRRIGMPVRRLSAGWRKKRAKRISTKKIAAVKEYLASLGIKSAKVSIRDNKTYIQTDRRGLGKIAKHLGSIKKKFRSLGVPEVLLRLAS
jgi:PP-loop superfamily ATP-utilizing enzyme